MPVSTYVALATTTLGATASSVTFGSIPTSYRDLVLVINIAATMNAGSVLTLNSDTSIANYSRVVAFGTGSSTGSNTYSGTGPARDVGAFRSNATNIMQFMDSSATDKHKTILTRASNTSDEVAMLASRYASSSAITSIEIAPDSGSFTAGSTFSLYGIEA